MHKKSRDKMMFFPLNTVIRSSKMYDFQHKLPGRMNANENGMHDWIFLQEFACSVIGIP